MNLGNLKIGTRLAVGFGAICAALVFMAGQSTLMLGRINDGTDEIVNKRMPRIEEATRIQAEVNDIAIALRNMMLSDDPEDRARQVNEVMSSRKNIDDLLVKLDHMLESQKGRALLVTQKELNARYLKGQQELMQLIERGDHEAARAYLVKQMRPLLASLKDVIAQQIETQTELATQTAAGAEVTYAETRSLMIVLGLAILLGAGALAWWITRSITRPVRRALDVANAVAAGDLTSRIEAEGRCEIAQLLGALKTMNTQLVATVTTVRTGTDAIATASAEVAAGNQDLSSRTEQQASSLEETASSMEELTSTVRQNADNARQANTLAETATGVAARGGQVIDEVVKTMTQIHEASGKVVDIISVIDGIAFQTNILALNAAVEAARAGEQGRGFAVVAGEVRSLAQRSAAAAKEIKTLIGDSSEKVETGSRLVKDAGATMEEIVVSVRRVTDILNEISSASQEQSAGIAQVNDAVAQMDAVTQQNAALVEEAAAASQAMQEQAQRLLQAVAVFRLEAGAAGAASAAPAPAPRAAAPAPRSMPARRPAIAATTRAAKPAAGGRAGASADSDWEEF
jgi:methyl-accepting chemotaxis protein